MKRLIETHINFRDTDIYGTFTNGEYAILSRPLEVGGIYAFIIDVRDNSSAVFYGTIMGFDQSVTPYLVDFLNDEAIFYLYVGQLDDNNKLGRITIGDAFGGGGRNNLVGATIRLVKIGTCAV